MKRLILTLAGVFSSTVLSTSSDLPTMYIGIGSCDVTGRPQSSFQVMIDGMTADTEDSSKGLLIYNEVSDPVLPEQFVTLAMSATMERQEDGSFKFENLLLTSGSGRITIRAGEETQSQVEDIQFVCRGTLMTEDSSE